MDNVIQAIIGTTVIALGIYCYAIHVVRWSQSSDKFGYWWKEKWTDKPVPWDPNKSKPDSTSDDDQGDKHA